MNGDWIDISLSLHPGMIRWPDDPTFQIERVKDMELGDQANTSRLSMSSHTGTHMDAPLHFLTTGEGIDQMPFSATIGLARVLEIQDRDAVRLEELRKHRVYPQERILFKTWNSSQASPSTPLPTKELIYLEPAAARWLVERRIGVAGIDSLSIGGDKKTGPETHRILLRAGIWIIEGLDLSQVKAGEYMLICLPLKIRDGDGAPARAILQPVK